MKEFSLIYFYIKSKFVNLLDMGQMKGTSSTLEVHNECSKNYNIALSHSSGSSGS